MKINGEKVMNLVVVSPQRQRLRDITAMLQGLEGQVEVTGVEGGLERLAAMPVQDEPDVLILDSSDNELAHLDKIERLNHLYPEMACIVLSESKSPDFLLRAMQAGVREVLPQPVSAPVLNASMNRLLKKAGGSAPRHGRILAFVGCKGGCGTTFIAANLAYALAQEEQKVLLLDLNLQFGDALLFISDQKATSTVADVAEQINRVDASFLASCLTPVTPNLGVLAAPEDPARALAIKPEHVDTLLRLARNNYDFVVIDAGRGLDPVSVRALDHADTIFPVLQLTLPFIRDGKRLMEAFRSLGYSRDKVKLLVNRFQKGGILGLSDIRQAVGREVDYVVPNNFEAVAASVNQGIPVLKLGPSSTVAKALRDIAQGLLPKAAHESGGWFARVFHRA